MKLINTFFFTFFLVLAGHVSAVAQTINGNTQVGVSTFQTYTYSGSYSTGYRWAVVGGTISSSSGLTVNIIWSGSPGTGKVQFYPSRFAFTPHELTVSKYANPSTPSTPSVSSNPCGNKTVTRGNPPSGITWYWQTSSSGVSTSNSSTTYTKTSSGYVYLRARRNSTGQWSSSASVYVTVNHAPSAPATPSVSTNTCGNKTVTRGNPPSGVTWYWQTSSGGTSTSNSSSTYAVTSSRNVYLKARNNSSGCWSSATSVFVSVNQTPAQPAALSVSSNGCGTKTVTRPSAPGGQTYYWQTSASGTSTSNSSGTYSVPSSRWVYLRARNDIGGCWSTVRSVYVTVNPLPSTPSTPTISSNTCGNKTVTRGNPPSGITWYWQTSASGASTTNSSSTYPMTSSGNVYLRARNNSTGCWSTSSSSVSVTVNHAPAAPSISGLNRCGTGNALLVVDGYSQNQLAPFKWYTSPSGGTAFESGISSINENVSSTTSYYVSRYDETTLCESARTQVTVTVQQPVHTTGSSESHCQTEVAVPLTGEPAFTGTWSINGPSSAIVFGNAVDMTALTPGQTYQVTYTYANGVCSSNTFVKDIYVRPLSVAGTISGNNVQCGSGAATFHLTGHTGTVLKWEKRYKNGSESWSGWSLITDTDDVLQVNPTLDQWSGGVRTYEIKASIQNGECNMVSATKQLTIDPQSVGGSVSGSKEAFESANGNLILSNHTGEVQRWEKSTDGGNTWSIISDTTTTYTYNVSTTTLFRAVVKSGICAEAVSSTAQVTILPVPNIGMVGLASIRDCQSTTLEATPGYAHYTWYLDDVIVQDSPSNQLSIDGPGNYKVTITSSNGAVYTINNPAITSQYLLNQNAITTFTYRVPTTEPDSSFCFTVAERSVDTQIFDGLGRPLQQVSLNASPLMKDIVVPMAYDELGRQPKNYLPYIDTVLSTIYKPNALLLQPDFYLDEKGSNKAFSEVRYEPSPLNRSLEQGAPGDSWQIGQKTVKFTYAIADSAEVLYWEFETILSNPKQVYAAGQLYENATFDEDSSQTVEYTNKQGQTILKKSQVDASTWAETYYIYDVYGQLAAVLPPEATSRLDAEFFGQSDVDRAVFLNTWAFLYDYDGRNRMTMKKVPGADSVFMVYDRWDRLVLTQDGIQRQNNQWLFTKYDTLNRPVMTGLAAITGTTDAVRNTVATSSQRAESFNASGINQYTDVTYPANSLIDHYLTVTYYDNYYWDTTGLDYTDPVGLTLQTAVKGQVTGTLTKMGNVYGAPGDWIKNVSYYDDKYRVIQTQSTNHLGGKDVVTNYYDFIGQVTRSISQHHDGDSTLTTTRFFTYDHAGRLLETRHQLNSGDSVLIAKNSYNELGELIEKDLHDGAEQSLDYTYNIRGWLTSMNSADVSSSSDGDLFGMELFYDEQDATLNNDQLYNGNISAMRWSDPVAPGADNSRAYNYSYDKLNRLKIADHFMGAVDTASYDVGGLTYDLNGNIESLQRRAQSTSAYMDDLSYSYVGNQLRAVSDAATDTTGFYDGFTATIDSADYAYDANGNMVKDRNKGIDSIYYNHLNLPTAVILSSVEGDSITYLYDAAGIKLKQTVYDSGVSVKITDYVGEYIYETDTSGIRSLQLIQHEEGRIIPVIASPGEAISSFDYQYHLKDHLGNVRMTFSTTPENYTMVEDFEGGDNGFENYNRIYTHANANTTVGGNQVCVVNGNGEISGMVLLSVNKGDTLDLSVNANYENAPSGNTFLALGYNALFNSFDGSFGGAEGVSGVATEFNDALSGPNMVGKSDASSAPRAYLNYIFFDEEMNYVTAGYQQVSTAANGIGVHETLTINDRIPEQDGYLLAYLSNENQEQVYMHFDDFTIYHGKTNVVSTQDYYPFGLTFNESVRVASTEQRFGFNGKEKDDFTGWNNFGARNYDASIGRFSKIDPLAELRPNLTPYRFGYNNPVNVTDPTGLIEVVINGRKTIGKEKRRLLRGFMKFFSSQSDDSENNDKDNNGFDDSQQSDPVDNPKITPTAKGVRGGRFGYTRTKSDGSRKFHDGTDIKASRGTTVRSILPGTVIATRSTLDPGEYLKDSYGNRVIVQSVDANGNTITLEYDHLDAVSVEVGDELESGAQIGESGSTGNAANIATWRHHVHIRARKNGERVDPEIYMKTKFELYSGRPYPGPYYKVPAGFKLEGFGKM